MVEPGSAARARLTTRQPGGLAIDAHRWLLPVIAHGTILAP